MKSKFTAKNKKNNRIIINNLQEALDTIADKEIQLIGDFSVKDFLSIYFNEENIKFKVDNSDDFIDYIKKLDEYNYYEDKLWSKIEKVKTLIISRVEFDRDQNFNRVSNYIGNKKIEEIDKKLYREIKGREVELLDKIEYKIKKQHLYAKDVELLKKIVFNNNEDISECYEESESTRFIYINIKKTRNHNYFKAEKGTVEYHKFLNNNLDRIKRLLFNLHKYIKEEEDNVYCLNQSCALQDSINIALAYYNNKEFKAISGKNNIKGFCSAPKETKAAFESYKVNKLGQMGYGYNRVNDSEKKILEEIHKEIENDTLSDEGKLVLITKLQPCPSCYSVMKQFLKLHPKVEIEVKYIKKYGEV